MAIKKFGKEFLNAFETVHVASSVSIPSKRGNGPDHIMKTALAVALGLNPLEAGQWS